MDVFEMSCAARIGLSENVAGREARWNLTGAEDIGEPMLFIAQPLDYFHLDRALMCARSSDRFATLTQVSKFAFVEPNESLFWSALSKGARPASEH
jgi:hypothetical protein